MAPEKGDRDHLAVAQTLPASPKGGPSPTPLFSAGERVGGRYRIVRLIAQGGAGQVFEAEDLELGLPIALKAIPADAAWQAGKLERFRREILLARRVTHRNVCRIFDVGVHEPETAAGTAPAAIRFLTMELLAGETLADRLRRKGPLCSAEALPIVAGMVAGLGAAHRAGVIHRDFKSQNVMLVPDGTEAGGERAVITDFGLARSEVVGLLGATTTLDGGHSSAPSTVAPEQIEGGLVGPPTDLYALGVVLFEMLTGHLPFRAPTPLDTLTLRLREPAPSPRRFVADVDPRWEEAILRCLERDPARRFARADEVVRALEARRPRRVGAALRGRGRRLALALAALVLAALGTGWAVRASRRGGLFGRAGRARAATRRSIAVVGFVNRTGARESAWIATALDEILSTELAAGGTLRAIPEESVAQARRDLQPPGQAGLPAELSARMGEHLGADLLVSGWYSTTGGQIHLEVRLQDARAGRTLAELDESGAESDLLTLAARMGTRLRARLGLGALSKAETGAVRSSVPAVPEAARLYAEGLEKLHQLDALAARDVLLRAVEADPEHPLAHAALSSAWGFLGYEARARAEAQRALELSGPLSREQQLKVEGRYREARGEWKRAADIYRSLFDFYPDNLDHGLALANAQIRAHRAKEAFATLEALRQLPLSAVDEPRLDLTYGRAAMAGADFARAQAAYERAAARAQALGARLFVAQARLAAGWTLYERGQIEHALAADEEARRIFLEAGDREGAARATRNVALIRSAQGDGAAARKLLEQALAAFREVGKRGAEALVLTDLADLARDAHDPLLSQTMLEQALAVARDIGDESIAATTLHSLALSDRRQGHLDAAKQHLDEALAIWRAQDDRTGLADGLNNLGSLLYDEGDLAGALRNYEEALKARRLVGDPCRVSQSLDHIATVLRARGELAEARKQLEQAMALCGRGDKAFQAHLLFQLGDLTLDAGSPAAAREQYDKGFAIRRELGVARATGPERLRLALLALEQGQAEKAEAEARELALAFHDRHIAFGETSASLLWARALLARHRAEAARPIADRALALAAGASLRSLRLQGLVLRARIEAARGRAAPAHRMLEAALAESSHLGFCVSMLEARLALGEIDLASGKRQARARLLALAEEARARGFGGLARRAGAAAQKRRS